MSPANELLLINAAIVALLHTLIGVDHYLPFIVLAKARNWSRLKTTWITTVCGIGHVGSSVILGLVGYAIGASLKKLQVIESVRGEVAAWILIGFGLIYALWGLYRARRAGPDGHTHSHGGMLHSADHIHDAKTGETIPLTPIVLFMIFAFGPCEPLIPLFIYPAATSGWATACLVALVFGLVTIGTMVSVVFASSLGLQKVTLNSEKLARYSHAIAGLSIAATGGAIEIFAL